MTRSLVLTSLLLIAASGVAVLAGTGMLSAHPLKIISGLNTGGNPLSGHLVGGSNPLLPPCKHGYIEIQGQCRKLASPKVG